MLFKIIIYSLFAVYFTGAYWICFSLFFFSWHDFETVEDYYIESELSRPMGYKILTSFYFALTTLSTVGLGDFYPKSDAEHMLGSLVILFGVALFSIINSELLDIIF